MTVQAILNVKGTDVATVPPDMSIKDVVHQLKDRGVGALVISSDGRVVEGIVSERDVVRGLARLGAGLLDMRVSELMTKDVHTGKLADTIAGVMTTMTERRIRHLPIVEDGALCGIVSIGDAVKARLGEVESEAHSLRDYIAGS